MFDYVRYLAAITGDDTWQQTAEGTFLNAQRNESEFVIQDDWVTLQIDCRPIYSGPLVEDHPEFDGCSQT